MPVLIILQEKIKKNEIEFLSWLSEECKKFNFEIILKSRFKRILPNRYNQFGRIFYDESFYPDSISELVYVSDLVLSYYCPGAICTEAVSLSKDFLICGEKKHQEKVNRYVDSYIEGLLLPRNGDEVIFQKEQIKQYLLGHFKVPFPQEYQEKFLPKLGGANTIAEVITNI